MIELVINIPNKKQRLVEEMIVELGGKVIATHKEKHTKSIANSSSKGKSAKVKADKALDHTYLFDKWKEYDIDVAKIREEAW